MCCRSILPSLLATVLTLQQSDADKKRGAEVFKETARKSCLEMVAQLKSEDPKEYDGLLKHSGAKSEKEAGDWMADQLLKVNESALAISEEKAKDIRSGMFNDEGNRKTFGDNLKECSRMKLALPSFIVHFVTKWNAGTLRGGIDLEFASRLLVEYLALVRPK